MMMPSAFAPLSVLVVDGEPKIRQVIGCFLRSRNLTVAEAGNGTEALQLLQARTIQPDLAIVDLALPNLDGLDFLQQLRTKRPDAAALLVSGYCEKPARMRAALNERTRFLRKPFNFKMLECEINALLPRPLPPAIAKSA